MNPFYLIVAERAEHACEYCRAPEAVFNFLFEVDHVVPTSKGGTTDLENLALSCRACNAYKASFEVGSSRSEKVTRLFNPRLDVWSEHFRINFQTMEVEGLSEVALGSIRRLRLNSSAQMKARSLWKDFGIFS